MKPSFHAIKIAAIATLFSVSAASASDLLDGLNEPAPEQAQVNWTGLWVGAVGGYNFFNSELDYFAGDEDQVHGNVDGLGAEGFFGEAQLGYDHQINNQFVVGIFGGVNLSDAEFNASIRYGDETDSIATDYEWGSVLGARLGLLKSPDTMFYVGGGWAHAQIGDTVVSEHDEDPVNIAGPEVDGWFGEVGMETRISNNIFMTVAGRYTDYGAQTLWQSDPEDCPERIEIDTDSLAVMVGIKAKLGGF
jgi:outer membrane immunogenic protein